MLLKQQQHHLPSKDTEETILETTVVENKNVRESALEETIKAGDQEGLYNTSSFFYTGTIEKIEQQCAKLKETEADVDSLPVFAAQFKQDSWLYFGMYSIFEKYGIKGVYLDLAAAYPKMLSNTFMFDMCFKWNGLCIEADPKKANKFRHSIRNCVLEEMCITKENGIRKFVSSENSGSTSVARSGQTVSKRGIIVEVKCGPLGGVLQKHNIQNIDFFSLDIEGYEADALSTIDFSKIKIDIAVVESAVEGSRSHNIFVENGFEAMGVLGLTNKNSRIDYIFVRKNSIWLKHCEWRKSELIEPKNPKEKSTVKSPWPFNCKITPEIIKNRFDE